MPATDSSSSASSSPAHHTSSSSFGRSILSLRHRDHNHNHNQIHHASFPPTPDHSSSSDDREIDAFQRHAADLLLDLLPSSSAASAAPEILSLDWTRHLLDSFLICLEEFRSVLFADAAKHSPGLLKEIHQIERCSRQLMELTDAAHFPLDQDKEAEVQEAAQELVQVCDTLKDGLDPLERQVREMFHRIVRTRTEILDCLSRPSTNTTE